MSSELPHQHNEVEPSSIQPNVDVAGLLSADNPLMKRWVEVQELAGPSGARARYIETLSETDELTGLRNRRGLLHELHKRFNTTDDTDQQEEVALVFLDIDGFKNVNDSFGHETGDEVLRKVGAFFRAEFEEDQTDQKPQFQLGNGDEAFRLGGDEFVVLLSIRRDEGGNRQVRPTNEAIELFERRMNNGIVNLGKTVNGAISISASFGSVVNKQGESPEEFIARADKLMYQAKMQKKAIIECENIEIHDFGCELPKRTVEWDNKSYTVVDTNNLAQNIADTVLKGSPITEEDKIESFKNDDVYHAFEWFTLKYPNISKRIATLLKDKKEILQGIRERRETTRAYLDWIGDYDDEVKVLGTYALSALYEFDTENYKKLLV